MALTKEILDPCADIDPGKSVFMTAPFSAYKSEFSACAEGAGFSMT